MGDQKEASLRVSFVFLLNEHPELDQLRDCGPTHLELAPSHLSDVAITLEIVSQLSGFGSFETNLVDHFFDITKRECRIKLTVWDDAGQDCWTERVWSKLLHCILLIGHNELTRFLFFIVHNELCDIFTTDVP